MLEGAGAGAGGWVGGRTPASVSPAARGRDSRPAPAAAAWFGASPRGRVRGSSPAVRARTGVDGWRGAVSLDERAVEHGAGAGTTLLSQRLMQMIKHRIGPEWPTSRRRRRLPSLPSHCRKAPPSLLDITGIITVSRLDEWSENRMRAHPRHDWRFPPHSPGPRRLPSFLFVRVFCADKGLRPFLFLRRQRRRPTWTRHPSDYSVLGRCRPMPTLLSQCGMQMESPRVGHNRHCHSFKGR